MEDRWKSSRGCPQCRRERVKRAKKKKSMSPENRRRRYDRARIRIIARSSVYEATKRGRLAKLPCRVCGSTSGIEAHHEDHTKKLDVIWLCQKHHHELHEKKGDK